MKLKDVKFGMKHQYHSSEHQEMCHVIGSHVDDGACLIIEIYRNGDLTGEPEYSEACYLTPATLPDAETRENGTLETHENNNMSLSCWASMTIENGVVKSKSHKGMPRSGGQDCWMSFYERHSIGDRVNESDIQCVLDVHGHANLISKYTPRGN